MAGVRKPKRKQFGNHQKRKQDKNWGFKRQSRSLRVFGCCALKTHILSERWDVKSDTEGYQPPINSRVWMPRSRNLKKQGAKRSSLKGSQALRPWTKDINSVPAYPSSAKRTSLWSPGWTDWVGPRSKFNRLNDLQQHGIHVKTLDGLIDTSALGKLAPLVVGLLTGLSEVERSLIQEWNR